MIQTVRKSTPRFTKSPCLVLIGLVLTEIQAFKNVKKLQRNEWKCGQIRTLAMTLYSSRWSLVTKLAIFAISASKHGGQLLNEDFIYSKDIIPSPGYWKGWRIYKMPALSLEPLFKNSYSRLLRIVN